MLTWLQRFPHFLEIIYDLTEKIILPFKAILKPNSWAEPLVILVEKAGKGALFNCQMCGQCILHSTGMTCSMTCPKNLRNGPCGGVRLDGNCEVKADTPCVWTQAYERSLKMPTYGAEMKIIQPLVNHQLKDTSSWINMLHDIDTDLPEGWQDTPDIPIINSNGEYHA